MSVRRREKGITVTLAFTFGGLLLWQDALLESFFHPNSGAVRTVLSDTAVAVMQLLFVGSFESLLLFLVNHAIIVRMCIFLSDKSLSLGVVAIIKVKARDGWICG
jgi:hypothetical protein